MSDNPGGGCLGTLIWLFCIGLLIAGCNAVVGAVNGPDGRECWSEGAKAYVRVSDENAEKFMDMGGFCK